MCKKSTSKMLQSCSVCDMHTAESMHKKDKKDTGEKGSKLPLVRESICFFYIDMKPISLHFGHSMKTLPFLTTLALTLTTTLFSEC